MSTPEGKGRNTRLIYQFISDNGSVSKQEIVICLKLSLPTVTQNLVYLEGQGLIDTNSKITNTGGRNATAFSYIENAKVAIGVDITNNHIRLVMINLSGNVVKVMKLRQLYDNTDEYLKILGEAVEEIVRECNVPEASILGVGIAVPGLVSEEEQKVTYGVVIPNKGMTAERYAKYIKYPVKLFHDAHAAGYAEVWSSKNINNAFYISLCNSVGGCVLIDNVVYRGNTNKAGEIGHMIVSQHGEECYCGQAGCLETCCNALILSKLADGNLNEFFNLLASGNEDAVKAWDQYLGFLALAISNVHILFDSDIIVGGYVGSYIEEYIEDLRNRVDALNPFKDSSEKYLFPCKYKMESVAAGAAINFIGDFIKNIG